MLEAVTMDKIKTLGVDGAVMYCWIASIVRDPMISNGDEGCGLMIDGTPWVRAPLSRLTEDLPFWSYKKIERTIKKLEESGHIKSMKLRAKKWDSAKYYSVV